MEQEPEAEQEITMKKQHNIFQVIFQRNPLRDIREMTEIIRYEIKRLLFTQKFFIAISLILLPAIIYLDASASKVSVYLLDIGLEGFSKRSAAGYVIIGQFLMQMIGIMLTLDSFGNAAKDSLQRYFAMPIKKINIFISHTITVALGMTITGVLSVLIFNLVLWIWTEVSLSFILLLKAFFLTFIGALLASATTTLFVTIANYFDFSSSLAIVPTLFLFYVIPFVVYFTAQFQYINVALENWTFMHQLAVATDYMIKPPNGLQKLLPTTALRTAWLVISLTITISEILAVIIFLRTEK